MLGSRKDILKHEISELQKSLGIHIIKTRNLKNLDECREAFKKIVLVYKAPDPIKMHELIVENMKLKRELNNYKLENHSLTVKNNSYKNFVKILKEDREGLLTNLENLKSNNRSWWSKIFG